MDCSYQIRPFEPSDRERVIAFFDSLDGEGRAFFNRNDGNRRWALKFFDGDNSNIIRWMMLDGDRMIGYVFLWDTDKSVVWLGIALAGGYKGRGLGAHLLAHAKNWAVEHGKGGIMLTTHVANLRAQSLYERCGYERLGSHSSGEVMYILRW
jgi:ribosomal protein S18 acetylase RimI-like enzyme